MQLTLGMNAFITAQGFARTGMLSVLIGAVINIALDPVFIFGFGMGVKEQHWQQFFPRHVPVSGCWLFMWKENASSLERKKYDIAGKYYLAEYCTWNSNVYYAGKRERDFSLL